MERLPVRDLGDKLPGNVEKITARATNAQEKRRGLECLGDNFEPATGILRPLFFRNALEKSHFRGGERYDRGKSVFAEVQGGHFRRIFGFAAKSRDFMDFTGIDLQTRSQVSRKMHSTCSQVTRQGLVDDFYIWKYQEIRVNIFPLSFPLRLFQWRNKLQLTDYQGESG